MGALKSYSYTIELEIEVRTDKVSGVHEKALGTLEDILSERRTAAGEERFAKAVNSIGIYKKD